MGRGESSDLAGSANLVKVRTEGVHTSRRTGNWLEVGTSGECI